MKISSAHSVYALSQDNAPAQAEATATETAGA